MTNGEPEAGVAVGPGRSAIDEPATASEAAGPIAGRAADDDADPQPLTSADYSVAFTPRNVAIGLAIVAGIVAFALRRRRSAADAEPPDEAG